MQLQLQVFHKLTAEYCAECITVIQIAEMLLPIFSNRLRETFGQKNQASATYLGKIDVVLLFGVFFLCNQLSLAEVKFNKLMNISE